jgi:hypothetical protein
VRFLPPVDSHRHAVKFYRNDSSLFVTVGGFLGQGLVDRQPAVLIDTAPHRDGILAELSNRLVDVRTAIRLGELVVLDAHETLAAFMDGDVPNASAFDRHVGTIIGELVNRHPGPSIVRAYGEMVDVLWREKRQEAAIRLEILWNKLAARHGFALLCGYAMGSFYKETDLLERVCEQHTHVMPPDAPALDPSVH